MSHVSTTSHTAHGDTHLDETTLGIDSRKIGVWAFIGSETMFFATLLAVYFVYKPLNVVRTDFQDPKHFLNIPFTSLLAAILLASSVTMVLALAAIRHSNMRLFRIWLLATVVLGLSFLGGQVYEFTKLYHEEVTLGSSFFGSTFFVLTGFHGTHVAIGVIWLLSVFAKIWRYPHASGNTMDVELAGLYWHFVDLVWVGLFTLIYLI